MELLREKVAQPGLNWYNEKQKWYFSVVDVVAVLTDSENPRRYWSDLKRKLNSEGASEPYEKIAQLKLLAPDGKRRLTHVADTEQRLKDEKSGRKTYALGRDQPV